MYASGTTVAAYRRWHFLTTARLGKRGGFRARVQAGMEIYLATDTAEAKPAFRRRYYRNGGCRGSAAAMDLAAAWLGCGGAVRVLGRRGADLLGTGCTLDHSTYGCSHYSRPSRRYFGFEPYLNTLVSRERTVSTHRYGRATSSSPITRGCTTSTIVARQCHGGTFHWCAVMIDPQRLFSMCLIPIGANMALSPDENRPPGTIVDHFLQHPEKVHFTFDHGNGHSREYPGLQLAREAAGLALRFRELGVKPGDRVAVIVPTSEPLLRTIVAAWFCRAGIVVLPHRLGGARSTASAEKLASMLAERRPSGW